MSEANSGAKEQTAPTSHHIFLSDMEARKAKGYPEPKTQDTVYSYLDSAFSPWVTKQRDEFHLRLTVVIGTVVSLKIPNDTVAKFSRFPKDIADLHPEEYSSQVASSNLDEDMDVSTSIKGLGESQHWTRDMLNSRLQ